MALVTHGDGKKIRIQPAIAIFLIIMGCIFLVDATSQTYALAAMSMVILGGIWYYLSIHLYSWFHHH